MIGVARKYLPGAVQLFGQHHSGKHMGPGLDPE